MNNTEYDLETGKMMKIPGIPSLGDYAWAKRRMVNQLAWREELISKENSIGDVYRSKAIQHMNARLAKRKK